MTTLEETRPEVDDTAPLVVVIDDRDDNRRTQIQAFERLGCRVLDAADLKGALDIALRTPGIDLFYTDINLNPPGQRANKDGVELARTLREQLDGNLPLAGVTAAFDDLPDEEKSLFNLMATRGFRTSEQIEQFNRDCVQWARVRHAVRSTISDQKLTEMRLRHPYLDVADIAHSEMRAHLAASSPDDLEETISHAGYELRLVTSAIFNELIQPIIVWYRRADDGVELEVYGQPALYMEAATEKEAFAELFSLILHFREDFRNLGHDSQPIGPALRLAEYLRSVIE